MKNIIVICCISAALSLSLTGCNEKESDFEKALKDGTETSKKMAGTDRPIPVPNIEPDKPQPKKNGGK